MLANIETLVDYSGMPLDVEITTRLNIRGEPSRKAPLVRRVKPPEVLQADLLVLGDEYLGNASWYREKGSGLFFWSGGTAVRTPSATQPTGQAPVIRQVHRRDNGTILPLSVTELESTFGIFAYTNNPNGSITITGNWEAQNIVTFSHPLLDAIGVSGLSVHRLAKARFRNAFDAIAAAGPRVSDMLLTCGGTFVPRHISHDPRRALSSHSWGVAIDLNVGWNAYHQIPQLPGRRGSVHELLPYFAEQGFAWGGHFSAAFRDGMHFELADYGIVDVAAQGPAAPATGAGSVALAAAPV